MSAASAISGSDGHSHNHLEPAGRGADRFHGVPVELVRTSHFDGVDASLSGKDLERIIRPDARPDRHVGRFVVSGSMAAITSGIGVGCQANAVERLPRVRAAAVDVKRHGSAILQSADHREAIGCALLPLCADCHVAGAVCRKGAVRNWPQVAFTTNGGEEKTGASKERERLDHFRTLSSARERGMIAG